MSWPQNQWQQQTVVATPGPPQVPIDPAPGVSTTTTLAAASGTVSSAPTMYSSGMPIQTATPAQYAALTPDQQFALQQNWQRWQTYHQQYAQWHAQYGEQYQREMQAKLGIVPPSLPFAAPFQPILPPNYTSVPPPLPDGKVPGPGSDMGKLVAATAQPPPPPPPLEEKNVQLPLEKKSEDTSFGTQDQQKNQSNLQQSNIQSWQQQSWQQQQMSVHFPWSQPPPFQTNFQQQPPTRPPLQLQPVQLTPNLNQAPHIQQQFGGQVYNQNQKQAGENSRSFGLINHDKRNSSNYDNHISSNHDIQDGRNIGNFTKDNESRNKQDWENNSICNNRNVQDWESSDDRNRSNWQQSNYSLNQCGQQQQFNKEQSLENDDEKTPEERVFDDQFRKWEEDFENWKKQNANHPDKKAYREYEMRFEDCRRKLLERREQMRKRKLENKMKQINAQKTIQGLNTNDNREPSTFFNIHQDSAKQNKTDQFLPAPHNNAPLISARNNADSSNLQNTMISTQESINQVKLIDDRKDSDMRSSQNDKSDISLCETKMESKEQMNIIQNEEHDNKKLEIENRYKSKEENLEDTKEKVVEFLKTTKSESGGIPGLDLVPSSSDEIDKAKSSDEATDVIDLEVSFKTDLDNRDQDEKLTNMFISNEQNRENEPFTNKEQQQEPSNHHPRSSHFQDQQDQSFHQEQQQSEQSCHQEQQLLQPSHHQRQQQNKQSQQSQQSLQEQLHHRQQNQEKSRSQQVPHIPSLLDQKIEKPTFSPPRRVCGPSFGQFLNENFSPDKSFNQQTCDLNSSTGVKDLTNALTNPNVLALLQAAISNAGGDINSLLNANLSLDNNAMMGGDRKTAFRQSPWMAGQEPFRGGYGGNFSGCRLRQDNENFGRNNDIGMDRGGGSVLSRRNKGNNFGWDRKIQNLRQGGGDFQRGNQTWNDTNRKFDFDGDSSFDRRQQKIDTDLRDKSASGSNIGPDLMNERSRSSERSNQFKEIDERNRDRDNRIRDCFNQARSSNSRDRSRSSSRQGDAPPIASSSANESAASSPSPRNPRNPFRQEPKMRNIFDDGLNSPINRRSGDRIQSQQNDENDYFRPAHVIDYQNKPLNENLISNTIIPTKIVDYGHKSSNLFESNNNSGGGERSAGVSEENNFFPMKTIDYGHASATVQNQNKNQDEQLENERRNWVKNQNNRFSNNFNQRGGGSGNTNNNYSDAGGQDSTNRTGGSGKNRKNRRNKNRWSKTGSQNKQQFHQNSTYQATTGNDNDKDLLCDNELKDIQTSKEVSTNELPQNQNIEDHFNNSSSPASCSPSNKSKQLSEKEISRDNFDEISENKADFEDVDYIDSSNLNNGDNNDLNNAVMEQQYGENCEKKFDNINNLFPIIENDPFNMIAYDKFSTSTITTSTNNVNSIIQSKFERIQCPIAPLAPSFKFINPSMETNTIRIDEILLRPGRCSRPKKIVVIIRGPPGSGKTYVAKLIKEKEVEMGGSTPRLLSIDDYFMSEVEKEQKCEKTGRKVIIKEMIYEYDKAMEGNYMQYLLKSFKKTINEHLFEFVIIDCVNSTLRTFTDFYNSAKEAGFMPYVIDLICDLETCLSRNIHNRSEEDIKSILSNWRPTPKQYIKLDITSLLQSAAIPEIEMEDISEVKDDDIDNKVPMDLDEYTNELGFFKSKWDVDCSGNRLARLDGTNKPLQKNTTMEDYLQLDDWKESNPSTTNKKRVRWADIEEKREQEKLRAIGFIVGHTDWKRMMDPSGGSKALTQTKYIEKIKK